MNPFHKQVLDEINQSLEKGDIEQIVEDIFFFYRKKEYVILEEIWSQWRENLKGTEVWEKPIKGKYLPYGIKVEDVLSQPLKSIFNKRGWGRKKIFNILRFIATAIKDKNVSKPSSDNQIPKKLESDKEIILTAEEIWNRWQRGETVVLEKIWFQWRENLKNTPSWNDFLYKWLRNNNELLPAKPLTISQILSQPLKKIFETRGWGRKKVVSILKCIIRAIENTSRKKNEITLPQFSQKESQFQDLQTVITDFLSNLDEKSRQVIEGRFIEGKTLEKLGKELGITRERVRQIVGKQLGRTIFLLEEIRKKINIFLDKHNGFAQFDKFLERYKVNEEKVRKFLYNLCCIWFKKDFKFVKGYVAKVEFFEKQASYIENVLDSQIEELGLPLEKNFLFLKVKDIVKEKGLRIPEDFLEFCLVKKKPIFDTNNQKKIMYFAKLSLTDNIALILKNYKEPVHFKELTYIISKFSSNQITPYNLENRIRTDKRFILVYSGQFLFYKNYKLFLAERTGLSVQELKKLMKKIVKETLELLKDKTDWTDTKYILTQLKQNISIPEIVTPYALKDILLRYPYFEGGRKFEIRLKLGNKQIARKEHADLIWNVLFEAKSALHVKDIQKRLRERHREIPLYGISQSIKRDVRFLRVADSTYTILENLNLYLEDITNIKTKCVEIIKQWGKPISYRILLDKLTEKNISFVQDWNFYIIHWILKDEPSIVVLSEKVFAFKNILPEHIRTFKHFIYEIVKNKQKPILVKELKEILERTLGFIEEKQLFSVFRNEHRLVKFYNFIFLKEWDITSFLPTIFTSEEKRIKRDIMKFKDKPGLTKIDLNKLILWLKFCMWDDLRVEAEFLVKFIKRFELVGQDKEYVERVKTRLGMS